MRIDAVRRRRNMQLRMMTDYAIRILIYMQMVGKAATRQEISAAMGITEGPLTLTLRRLRDAGWIESFVGSEGGVAAHQRNQKRIDAGCHEDHRGYDPIEPLPGR